MLTSEEVKRLGREAGFDIVRITTAEPFPQFVPAVEERRGRGCFPEDMLRAYEALRRPRVAADPRSALPGARSVISLALAYRIEGTADRSGPGRPCGRLPRCEWRDFYGEVARRRRAFVELLRARGARCEDPREVTGKNAAHRAGAAAYVRSGLVHAETYGPWVLLATVLTDLDLPPDEPVRMECGTCQRCVSACPARAIVQPYVIDGRRCLVHVLASSEWIPRELRPAVGNRISSCDQCLEVCPRALNPLIVPDALPDPRGRWTNSPELVPLLDIGEEDFRREFGSLHWYAADPLLLKRNAVVALGNSGDPAAIPALERMLHDNAPILRGHAAWALGRLGGAAAVSALRKAREEEADDTVIGEIDAALVESGMGRG